jgi:hypothetical protein
MGELSRMHEPMRGRDRSVPATNWRLSREVGENVGKTRQVIVFMGEMADPASAKKHLLEKNL